ncbi:MAG: IS66 family insertion sequence element accessory protein TnpA [bacterium]|jgi:hypothetical protein
MDEQTQTAGARRRRSRAEVEQVAAEFETSGLKPTEFCRAHGLSLSTLNRYRNRRAQQGEAAGGSQWLAVEVSGPDHTIRRAGGSGIAVVLGGGRRIEVERGFDPGTLAQLVQVLERL